MLQNFNIKDYQSEMEAEMISISDSFFGTNYFKQHILPLYQQQKNAFLHVAITDQNNIAGFALGFCLNKTEIDAFLKVELPKNINLPKKIAILNTVAVKTEFQKKHLGKQLIENLLHSFETKDVRDCLALGWKHEGIIYADQLNKKMGFQPTFEVPDFWREDVLSKKYQCVVCGDDCHCSAMIYHKKW